MYSGHYSEQLKSYIAENGTINPEITDVDGNVVISNVEFKLVDDEIELRVDGTEYTSLAAALVELESKYATHFATGSNTAGGNAANNIIGNHDIFGHTILNGLSLKEILGIDVILEKRRVSKQIFDPKKASSAAEKVYSSMKHKWPSDSYVYNKMEAMFNQGIGYANSAKKVMEELKRKNNGEHSPKVFSR